MTMKYIFFMWISFKRSNVKYNQVRKCMVTDRDYYKVDYLLVLLF